MQRFPFLLLFCLAALVRAGDVHLDPATGLKFPSQVGEWTRGAPHTFDDPKQGVSLPFRKAGGHTVTLYVYTSSHSTIPSGAGSQLLRAEIEAVGAAIVQAWEQKGAKVTGPKTIRELRDDACAGVFALTSVHRIALGGHELVSISGVTGYKDHILKLRYTFEGTDEEAGLIAAGEFVMGLFKANADDLDPYFKCVLAANLGAHRP